MVIFYRRLPKFDYLKPASLAEVLGLLAEHKDKVKIIAGGTDLIPRLKQRICEVPKYIVDIKNISELNYIKYEKTQGLLKIGALATINEVEKSPVIRDKFSVISRAAATMASTQIRNRGTIAGNICNAVPSADSIPALLVLGAKVKVVSEKGVRIINLENFFTGPGKTALTSDELLQEIQVPDALQNGTGCYLKLSPRQSMDLAVVGVAVSLMVLKSFCHEIRIALGAVSPTPMRAKKAETILRGKSLNSTLIEQAASMAADESRPISDHRASVDYRREMVAVLTKRAIEQSISS